MSKKYKKNTKFWYMQKLSNTLEKLSTISEELGGASEADKELLAEVDDDIYQTLVEKEEKWNG